LTKPFRLRTAALLLEPSLDRGLARLRRDPAALDVERLAECVGDSLGCELAVPGLAALVLGDGSQDRAGLAYDPVLLPVRE
jgi:hypothetical protein